MNEKTGVPLASYVFIHSSYFLSFLVWFLLLMTSIEIHFTQAQFLILGTHIELRRNQQIQHSGASCSQAQDGQTAIMSPVRQARFVTATITAICFTEIVTRHVEVLRAPVFASDKMPRHQAAASGQLLRRIIGPLWGSSAYFSCICGTSA